MKLRTFFAWLVVSEIITCVVSVVLRWNVLTAMLYTAIFVVAVTSALALVDKLLEG